MVRTHDGFWQPSMLVSRVVVGLAIFVWPMISAGAASAEQSGPKFHRDIQQTASGAGVPSERAYSDLETLLALVLGCDIPDSSTIAGPTPTLAVGAEACEQTVAKWPKNVSVWVDGGTAIDRDYILNVFNEVGAVSGVSFDRAWIAGFANIRISYLSSDDKSALVRGIKDGTIRKESVVRRLTLFLDGGGNGCVGLLSRAKSGELKKYVLYVDRTRPQNDQDSCLADTIVRLAGLMGGEQVIGAATISDDPAARRAYGLLPDSLRALELLSGDWLKAGMTASEALRAYEDSRANEMAIGK